MHPLHNIIHAARPLLSQTNHSEFESSTHNSEPSLMILLLMPLVSIMCYSLLPQISIVSLSSTFLIYETVMCIFETMFQPVACVKGHLECLLYGAVLCFSVATSVVLLFYL
jgi:hypothetical protein